MQRRPTFHEQVTRSGLSTSVLGRSSSPTRLESDQLQAALISHNFCGDYVLVEGGRDHTIVFPVCQPTSVFRFYDDRLSGTAEHVGKISIMPAMRDAGWQSDQRVEVLHIYLCDEALRKIAETVTGKTATDVSISDGLDLNDPFMAGIAGKILREIQSPSALSSLMIEHLQHVIAVHMLRTYSNLSDPTVKALTRPIRMGKSDLQPALDYLNDNIQESVSLDDLADLANVPTSQLLRSFRYVIGTTPHQYLIQRRIEKARDLLTNTRLSIAEIAYECGFSSQSHMTTVFADKLGITPGKYRRQVR